MNPGCEYSDSRLGGGVAARSAPVELLRWAAGLGAITAEALAMRLDLGVGSARGRLQAAQEKRLLVRHRPLAGQPALYAVTRAGLRAAGIEGIDPCKVSASGALHLIECARAAAA